MYQINNHQKMKKNILALSSVFLVVLIVVGSAFKSEPKEVGIQFVELPWAKVLEKAKKEKKPIFFDAYASWCGPCKAMQKRVFTQPAVAEYFNKNFINYKQDMEIGEGPMLATKYPLEAYPTLFFIDEKGKIIRTEVGGRNADDLIALGKAVAGK
jgi:thiol-disulfide isomerase/thioredoxin